MQQEVIKEAPKGGEGAPPQSLKVSRTFSFSELEDSTAGYKEAL